MDFKQLQGKGSVKGHRKLLRYKDVFQEGDKIKSGSVLLNIDKSLIGKKVTVNGFYRKNKVRTKSEYKQIHTPRERDYEGEVIKLYKEGNSINKIAKITTFTARRVYYILEKNNIKLKRRNVLTVALRKKIFKEAKDTPIAHIAKKYNLGIMFLHRLLNSEDISDDLRQAIINYKKTGLNPSKIANALSIQTKTVKNVLKDYKPNEGILNKVGLTKEEVQKIRTQMAKDKFKEKQSDFIDI